MRNVLRRLSLFVVLPLVGAAISMGQPMRVSAAEADTGMKNVVVVSIAGYDALMEDIDFVGRLSGNEGLGEQLDGMLELFTQGQGLAGLDKAKPWGVVVQTDGQQIEPLIFLPVNDLKQLLEILSVFGVEGEEGDGGVYEFADVELPGVGAQTIYVTEKNGWALITVSKSALENAPADPVKLLDGLYEKYDLAVRLYVSNIPDMFRQLAIGQLQAGVEGGLNRLPGEGADQFQLRKSIVDEQVKALSRIVQETEHVTIGWTLDSKAENTYLDLNLTAGPGSDLAKQMARLRDAKTAFGGFVQPDSAATLNFSGKYSADEAKQLVSTLNGFRDRAMEQLEKSGEIPPEAEDTVKAALNELFAVLQATAESGRMDGGALVNLTDDSLCVAAGLHLVDASRLEKAVKSVVSLAENDPNFPGVKWNAATHEGVHFHTTSVPVPAAESEARKILGDELDVVVGFGPDTFYIALGEGGLDTLKKAIDQSKANADKAVKPMTLSLSLSRILNFAKSQTDDPQVAKAAELLAQAEGKDHVTLSVEAIPNGARYRLEAEKGVLEALGKALASAAGGLPVGL